MSVYIDSYNAPYGRMKMSHLVADTTKELLDMVDKIGVNKKWMQKKGKYDEHFDICLSKKLLAIQNGAIEINLKELITFMRNKRKIFTEQGKIKNPARGN